MLERFEYKRATMEDLDELVRTRISVFRAANKLSDDEDMSVVEEESYAYYRRALETGEHIAYLVYDNGAFIGAGGVSFYQVMPTYHNPTGKKVFIITPFRTVAESMRKFVVGYFSAKGNDKEVLKKWTKKCVGTVHTFQGKDANEVIFVLGCSDKSVGAMNWVVKKANILNVACTRAKYRIAFIGNLNDWKNRRYFREFIPQFIDTIDV